MIESISKRLNSASTEGKSFAAPLVQASYLDIPDELVAPGGMVLSAGADTVRKQIGGLMRDLPGSQSFLRKLPKATRASAQSGKEEDKFVDSGTFADNPALRGKWLYLSSVSDSPEKVTQRHIDRAYAQIEKKKQQSGRNGPRPQYLILAADGSVGSDATKFWTGDLLVDITIGEARRMTVITVGSKRYLVVEKPVFSEGKVATGYDLYATAGK